MSKICKICLNNDILCQACNAKLESGKITPIEVGISRILHKLGIEAGFIKAVERGMVYILADKKNARILIGRNGRNSKKLEAELKKKIRIIENTEEKGVIESILGTDIIGINILYSPKEKYRIRVQRFFRNRVNNEKINVINSLLDKDFEVVFE